MLSAWPTLPEYFTVILIAFHCNALKRASSVCQAPFLQVSAFTRLSFMWYQFYVSSDYIHVLTSCFKSLHVAHFLSGWVWHFLDFGVWITAGLIWTQLNKNDFLLPFGRQTGRQQPLLTPTVLIGLFRAHIRAMNANDDDSHSVSDGLRSHSHVALEGLHGVQVRLLTISFKSRTLQYYPAGLPRTPMNNCPDVDLHEVATHRQPAKVNWR